MGSHFHCNFPPPWAILSHRSIWSPICKGNSFSFLLTANARGLKPWASRSYITCTFLWWLPIQIQGVHSSDSPSVRTMIWNLLFLPNIGKKSEYPVVMCTALLHTHTSLVMKLDCQLAQGRPQLLSSVRHRPLLYCPELLVHGLTPSLDTPCLRYSILSWNR